MLLLANAHICIKNDAHQLQALELIHMDMDVQLGGRGEALSGINLCSPTPPSTAALSSS